ncbi:comEA protein [Alloscardovia omnicolens]|nr:comEA protein [Alloscardovia omnicolens]
MKTQRDPQIFTTQLNDMRTVSARDRSFSPLWLSRTERHHPAHKGDANQKESNNHADIMRHLPSALPTFLGSPTWSILTILILIFALSISLTLLCIQSSAMMRLQTAQSETYNYSQDYKQTAKSEGKEQEQSVQQPAEQSAEQQSQQQSSEQPAEQQTQAAPDPRININTASVDQLQNIPGVGPVTAQKILDYRSSHGSFASVDDLMEISGIGAKTLEKMRSHVRVQ